MQESPLFPADFQRAYEVVRDKIRITGITPVSHISKLQTLSTNQVMLFEESFKSSKIPSRPGWCWNQTKGRRTATLSDPKATIEFFKLMPRRSAQAPIKDLPTLKLWQYNIVFQGSTKPISMIWCEKGDDWVSKNLHLEDYEFLAEFMEPTVANELWPRVHYYM